MLSFHLCILSLCLLQWDYQNAISITLVLLLHVCPGHSPAAMAGVCSVNKDRWMIKSSYVSEFTRREQGRWPSTGGLSLHLNGRASVSHLNLLGRAWAGKMRGRYCEDSIASRCFCIISIQTTYKEMDRLPPLLPSSTCAMGRGSTWPLLLPPPLHVLEEELGEEAGEAPTMLQYVPPLSTSLSCFCSFSFGYSLLCAHYSPHFERFSVL